MMKLLSFSFYALFLLILLGVGMLFVGPAVPGLPQLEVKIVKSGSMEPSIMTGGVVVVAPAPAYQNGEVITFADQNASIPTTHRIVETYAENGQTWFVTKGDANDSVDALPVAEGEVVGRVLLTVPYVGFLFDFARQPLGFALLIVLPALLIVLGEVEKIWREILVMRGRAGAGVLRVKQSRGLVPAPANPTETAPPRMIDIGVPVRLRREELTQSSVPDLFSYLPRTVKSPARPFHSEWVMPTFSIFFSLIFCAASLMPYTVSYFSDTESSLGNVFGAAESFGGGLPDQLTFAVTPESACFNYTSGESFSGMVDFTLSTGDVNTSNFQVQTISVTGDNFLCERLQVAVDGTTPLPIGQLNHAFSADTLSLHFSDSSTINPGKRLCTIQLKFTTAHEGVVYEEQATVQVGDIKNHQCSPAASAQTIDMINTQNDGLDAEIQDEEVADLPVAPALELVEMTDTETTPEAPVVEEEGAEEEEMEPAPEEEPLEVPEPTEVEPAESEVFEEEPRETPEPVEVESVESELPVETEI